MSRDRFYEDLFLSAIYDAWHPRTLQVVHEPLLVTEASFPQNFEHRVPHVRLRELSGSNLDVERGKPPTVQMTDQVGCGKLKTRGNFFHG